MIMFNASGIADVLDFLQLQQYCIIMMTEDKNDYYMIASTHNKMYDIPVYIHKELSNGNHSLPVNLSFN